MKYSIGWTVFCGIGTVGVISGGCFNTAVYLGVIVSEQACYSHLNSDEQKSFGNPKWDKMWIFIISGILGGISAGLLSRFIFLTKQQRAQVKKTS